MNRVPKPVIIVRAAALCAAALCTMGCEIPATTAITIAAAGAQDLHEQSLPDLTDDELASHRRIVVQLHDGAVLVGDLTAETLDAIDDEIASRP